MTVPRRVPHINEPISGEDGRANDNWHRFLSDAATDAAELQDAIDALPATATQYQANAEDVLLGPNAVWNAAAFESLTDAATIAIDMSLLFNMSVTIAGNRTLGNPTSTKVGQSGCIAVTASGGTRTLNKGSNWKSTDISWPISLASGTTTYIFYFVVSSTIILVTGLSENPT